MLDIAADKAWHFTCLSQQRLGDSLPPCTWSTGSGWWPPREEWGVPLALNCFGPESIYTQRFFGQNWLQGTKIIARKFGKYRGAPEVVLIISLLQTPPFLSF